MNKLLRILFLLLFVQKTDAQTSLPALINAMDTAGMGKVIRQTDSKLLFFTTTGGNFYSDRLYANADHDDEYNGIRTSKIKLATLNHCRTRAVELDKWRRILVAGYSYTIDGKRVATMTRLTKEGDLDADFEPGVITVSPSESSEFNGICLLPDEKIVVAGTCYTDTGSSFFFSKFIYNGATEETFGNKGLNVDKAMTGYNKAVNMALLANGKFIVAGNRYTNDECGIILARYNTDGGRDYTYGTDGIATNTPPAGDFLLTKRMILLFDEKVLIAGTCAGKSGGTDMFIARFTEQGVMDNTFGNNGIVRIDVTFQDRTDDIAALPDGRILLSGAGSSKNEQLASKHILLRFSENGVIDKTYGYGSPEGIKPYQLPKNYGAFSHNIAVSPTNARAFRLSELVTPTNITETIVTLAVYLPDTNLDILDLANKKKQTLVYPIPVTNEISFQYELIDSQKVGIQLFDNNGKITTTVKAQSMETEGEHSFMVSFPPSAMPGRYEAVLTTSENYRTTIEITKQ